MKKQAIGALKAAALIAAFAFCFSPSHGSAFLGASVEFVMATSQAQLTQGWTREAAIHVASTATLANTDLRGTVTRGYDKVVVHNKDADDWVGCQPVPVGQQGAHTASTFATMTVFVRPNGTVEIEGEDIIRLRHITDTGTAANLIIERHERR